ncbi:hypothetical protein SYNPS1DRAFT_28970 [Syncephalis pseudoplumigaleata]|uniref:Uncharacterized protein n=1 Tax=Syncephalis pseudoplumigaleata TaxID=1712513 RepID=A0A4P9YYV3_9FUNG|nr:hypothetical protein SYNPS1DRAFT_28970 [Syncephalis pseudoplumigaleata]|eukprot:RKP25296.1 hypothetical protein SYNPS1DRAFT_28970 [Syncephalis pseudoplumigaleata]
MSSAFLVLTPQAKASAYDDEWKPIVLFVWPVSRIATMEPRCLSYYGFAQYDVRGRWLLFYTQEEQSAGDTRSTATLIRVMDLATGRSSVLCLSTKPQFVLLQRVTETAAIVLLASYWYVGEHPSVEWSLWQFSIVGTDGDHRCLVRGQFEASDYLDLTTIRRLDDHRFIFTNVHTELSETEQEAGSNSATLAVISTQHSNGDHAIENRPPLWSRCANMHAVHTMTSQDRIFVFAHEDWIVYSMTDGSILSSVSMNIFGPVLAEHCISRFEYRLHSGESYKGNYFICPSIDGNSLVAVNVMHPQRVRRMRIAYLMGQCYGYADEPGTPGILTRSKHQYHGTLPQEQPAIKIVAELPHALCIGYGDICKMLDLSI